MLIAVVLEQGNEMGLFCLYYHLQALNSFQMQSASY